MEKHVIVADSTEPGFAPVWVCNEWRLAVINDSPAFRKENITVMSRHLLTDETFTLLDGKANIYYGGSNSEPEIINIMPLKIGITAVVKKGVWHAVETLPGAKILVAENSDTSSANSEKCKLEEGQLPKYP